MRFSTISLSTFLSLYMYPYPYPPSILQEDFHDTLCKICRSGMMIAWDLNSISVLYMPIHHHGTKNGGNRGSGNPSRAERGDLGLRCMTSSFSPSSTNVLVTSFISTAQLRLRWTAKRFSFATPGVTWVCLWMINSSIEASEKPAPERHSNTSSLGQKPCSTHPCC